MKTQNIYSVFLAVAARSSHAHLQPVIGHRSDRSTQEMTNTSGVRQGSTLPGVFVQIIYHIQYINDSCKNDTVNTCTHPSSIP